MHSTDLAVSASATTLAATPAVPRLAARGLTKRYGDVVALNALDLAYIPETVMLYKQLSALENLDYFAGLAAEAPLPREQLMAHLRDVGLRDEQVHQRVAGFSKGMRQKVGIAIAVARKADVLLLDEPTSGLDPKASNEFSEVIGRLRERGAAVLMATHDLFRAKESGTRVGIMKRGMLVAELATADIGHTDLEQLYLTHMHD